jgi:2-desacetyl-2-hydroxyethyl bacteriochlorophyllide A dehydrogenase
MRALWLEDQRLIFRSDLPIPVPAMDQALVRVHLAGICSTDLELKRGYYSYRGIPGHEFVGEVVSSPGQGAWEGQRVVGEINIACGACSMCKAGLPRHCEQRKTMGIHDWNGGFAEYLVLPQANLHHVPASLADELAVFTEPLAAAFEILEQVAIKPQDRVLVVGAGKLGQLLAQVLQTTGCELEVVARHEKQQQLLADRKVRTVIEADLGSKKYDVVVEATGSPTGFEFARQSVRQRGTLILKSTYRGDMQVNFSDIVVNELCLIGSRCGPFDPALRLLAQARVDPKPLIEAVYSLSQGVMAFTQAGQPGSLKVLIQPE